MPTLNSLNVKGPLSAGVDQFVASTTVAGSAITSYTFSGLAGNTSLTYYFKLRIINGYNGSCNFYVYLNNDTAANYGYQTFKGATSTVTAASSTTAAGIPIGVTGIGTLAHVSSSDVIIFAKSGVVRQAEQWVIGDFTGTTGVYAEHSCHSWSNTADEVTSIVVGASQTGGLGIGTSLELWAMRPAKA